MDAHSLGEAIARGLHQYEDLLRDAHVTALRLQLDMRTIQAVAGQSSIAAYQLFSKLDEAQAQVSAALGTLAVAHVMARKSAHLAGVDPTAYGEETPPNEEVRRFAGQSQLQAAA